MANRSKLVRISIRNIGCVGDVPLTVELDNIVCLVGRNNSGKSTVLKAYELVAGKSPFVWGVDRCQWAPANQPSEVILDVHIPEGIANIHEKWKIKEGNMLIVRSRWQWAPPNYTMVRMTWDPETNAFSEDEKAGGADSVFKSRLPRPLRIGSLDDAKTSENSLLQLALSPFDAILKAMQSNAESPLSKAIGSLVQSIEKLTTAHTERFNSISERIGVGFKDIFPNLQVRLAIGMTPPTVKAAELVKDGSALLVSDGSAETTLEQQGTGARRALFWSMLQVHNELKREEEIGAAIEKLEKELEKAKNKKGGEAKALELQGQIEALKTKTDEVDKDDPAFPGHILLIDEPENALHPMATRAAQRHLYKLAEDPDWQVILTTHSPYFVNPLSDHTTIVRLHRANHKGASVTPQIFRSDAPNFDGPTKKRLRALQQLDTDLAEVFFGSYPILVEGDTEHAAFIAAVLEEDHQLVEEITIVRARGKALLVPLIEILKHFRIPFGVLHDIDTPYKSDGTANGMWTENKKIRKAVEECRSLGIAVRHRISNPDFERRTGGDQLNGGKPLEMYERVSSDPNLKAEIQNLLQELVHGDDDQFEISNGVTFMDILSDKAKKWAIENGKADELTYKGK